MDRDWAIVGSGIRSHDAEIREALLNQDFLSTVVELEPNTNTVRIIGSTLNILPVEALNHSLVEALSAPWSRIVSMTITEGGYFIDPATGESESGKIIFLEDNNSERLRKTSQEARENPPVFLGLQDIFGDLGKHPVFEKRISEALRSFGQREWKKCWRVTYFCKLRPSNTGIGQNFFL